LYELAQPLRRRSPLDPRAEASALRDRTVARVAEAAASLDAKRHADGYWCGLLTADVSLEADYVLLQLWLHQPRGGTWDPPSRPRIDKCCGAILDRQLPGGGWEQYPGSGPDINLSVKAYTALKLAGHDPNGEPLRRARAVVLDLGGVQGCNSYTRINLSLFGLFPQRFVPTVPPEIVLLPGNILYEMSSWTRAIVVPLSVVQAAGRERRPPPGFTLDELFAPGRRLALASREGLAFLFHHIDRLVKLWDKRGLKNLRATALREAERWMLERTRYTDGLGAIYPSMMYMIMALDSLGYAEDHPDLLEAIRRLDDLIVDRDGRFFFQPCVSPVWDTAIAAFALGEAGRGDPVGMRATADWLISREVRRRGDWSVKRPQLEPSGWAFEFANEFYPDIDDTAMVLLAFLHAKSTDAARQQRVVRRAINWLQGMQSKDGGWAAFDVDNDWQILNRLPFADHNAMLDPTCPDITGRVLEALVRQGVPRDHDSVRNGVRYLLGCQEGDGSWYGRWGVNYVYGTFLALRGLHAASESGARGPMDKAAGWLRAVQNRDGGWGESCTSYLKSHFVQAPSTPSQTAWALLGLVAAGDGGSQAVRRGVEHLVDAQLGDGGWEETLCTGTGFPNVFYLNYHLYRHYFPLLALAVCGPQVR
jgi:squalene-hopene/tetraprenyl-beta-curcumene cyclase